MPLVIRPSEKPPEESSNAAKEEASRLQVGDLERQEKVNTHNRNESFRKHLKTVITLLIWLGFILASLASCTWAWHFLTPFKYHWLLPDQVDKIQTILFTLAAAGGVQAFAKKHV